MAKYEVRLRGEDAKLGQVAAADVGKLLIGVQRAVARAAGSAIGRRPKTTGRWEAVIEGATRLRLLGVRAGSVVIELEPTATQPSADELDMSVGSLADLGWETLLRAISEPAAADLDVVLRLSQLTDELGVGERYEALEFTTAGSPSGLRIDRGSRERLHAVLDEQRRRDAPPTSVVGLLVEADFEKRSAHVRTPTGELVELEFDENHADGIYDALRQRSQFAGDVTYDPITQAVRSVKIRQIMRTEQLLLGDEGTAFWRDERVEDIVAEQNGREVTSFENLRDNSLSDEEFATFSAVLE